MADWLEVCKGVVFAPREGKFDISVAWWILSITCNLATDLVPVREIKDALKNSQGKMLSPSMCERLSQGHVHVAAEAPTNRGTFSILNPNSM